MSDGLAYYVETLRRLSAKLGSWAARLRSLADGEIDFGRQHEIAMLIADIEHDRRCLQSRAKAATKPPDGDKGASP